LLKIIEPAITLKIVNVLSSFSFIFCFKDIAFEMPVCLLLTLAMYNCKQNSTSLKYLEYLLYNENDDTNDINDNNINNTNNTNIFDIFSQ